MYSDLAQQKASNPDGFAANATAWSNALTRAALAGKLPVEQKVLLQTSTQLLDDLRSPGYGIPTGLGAVFDEAIQNGKMIDLKQFMGLEHSIFEKSWLPTPWTIIQWTLRQAGLVSRNSYDQSGRLRAGQLVLVDALEEVTKQLKILQDRRGNAMTDRVMTRDVFADLVAQTHTGALSREEIEILLKFLSRDKQLIAYNSQIVKFKSSSATQPEMLTEEDTTIATMKALMTSLDTQISELSARVESFQTTAYLAVQSKNKTSALSALRSKKLAEKNLQSRISTLHQLEEVFAKIEQAVDQVQIMQVMQSSADTLKSLNQRVGGVEKVDLVMENLREQMGVVSEVGQILQEPMHSNAIVDEAEVDEELEALEKQEATKKEEAQAEATRNKLAELERVEAAAKTRAMENGVPEAQVDADLESSSQRLQRIRLEEDETAASEQSKDNAQLEAA